MFSIRYRRTNGRQGPTYHQPPQAIDPKSLVQVPRDGGGGFDRHVVREAVVAAGDDLQGGVGEQAEQAFADGRGADIVGVAP